MNALIHSAFGNNDAYTNNTLTYFIAIKARSLTDQNPFFSRNLRNTYLDMAFGYSYLRPETTCYTNAMKCYPNILQPENKKARENKIIDLLTEHATDDEIEAYLNAEYDPRKAARVLIQLAQKLKKISKNADVHLLIERAKEIRNHKPLLSETFNEKKVEAQKELMAHIKDNFDEYDANNDGFITLQEIKEARRNGKVPADELSPEAEENFDTIEERFEELHFANIDSGGQAWHGFSKNDINNLHDRLDRNESLDQIADALRKQIIRDRNLGDDAGFAQHIAFNKINALYNPQDYGLSVKQQRQLAQNGQYQGISVF